MEGEGLHTWFQIILFSRYLIAITSLFIVCIPLFYCIVPHYYNLFLYIPYIILSFLHSFLNCIFCLYSWWKRQIINVLDSIALEFLNNAFFISEPNYSKTFCYSCYVNIKIYAFLPVCYELNSRFWRLPLKPFMVWDSVYPHVNGWDIKPFRMLASQLSSLYLLKNFLLQATRPLFCCKKILYWNLFLEILLHFPTIDIFWALVYCLVVPLEIFLPQQQDMHLALLCILAS